MLEQPPTLRGYNFTPYEAHKARVSERLLSMRTELSHGCNYRCVYCNEGVNRDRGLSLSLGLVKDVVCQVKDLGAVSDVIIGGSEPLLYPEYSHLIGCSGQVKTDTKLSQPCDFFVFIGTDVPEIRMFAATVVEHLDIIDDVITGFLTRQIIWVNPDLATPKERKTNKLDSSLRSE